MRAESGSDASSPPPKLCKIFSFHPPAPVFDSSKAVKGYVLSVGGFLGMGSRYVVVDTDSVKVKYDMADKKWHANMNATKGELTAAPEFKYEGQWNATKS